MHCKLRQLNGAEQHKAGIPTEWISQFDSDGLFAYSDNSYPSSRVSLLYLLHISKDSSQTEMLGSISSCHIRHVRFMTSCFSLFDQLFNAAILRAG